MAMESHIAQTSSVQNTIIRQTVRQRKGIHILDVNGRAVMATVIAHMRSLTMSHMSINLLSSFIFL